MSSSTDDDDILVDDDEEDDYDGFDTDYYDQYEDNNELDYDLSNDDYFEDLLNSFLEYSIDSNPVDVKHVRSAIDDLSYVSPSRQNVFGDLIESYLERPSFIQPTCSSSSSFYLSLTSTDLTPSRTEIPKDRLFVTNVAPNSSNAQLKQFLESLGYRDIANVHVSYKQNRRTGLAFIDCKTEKTAQDLVHDCAKWPQKFMFKNVTLRIVLNERDRRPPKFPRSIPVVDDGSPSAITFPIECSVSLFKERCDTKV
jgi:hypothetical protein